MKDKIRRILVQRDKACVAGEDLIRSAVLVPLFEKSGEYHLLFTQRTEKMSSHKGQMSFPGGRWQDGETLQDTALRESWEEIGLKPEDVEVLGELDEATTLSSGYAICPFVGIIPYPYDFEINPDEVEEIVEVPMSALGDTSCYRAVDSPGMGNANKYRQLARFYEGRPSMAWFYEYDSHVIWGATARIVKSFLELIFAEEVE